MAYVCHICSNIIHNPTLVVVDCFNDIHYCKPCHAFLLKTAKEREAREAQEKTLNKLSVEEQQLIGSITKRERKAVNRFVPK